MDGGIIELIRNMLANDMATPLILAVLGILGVRNKEAIMAVIASILNPNPGPAPAPGPIPAPGPTPGPLPAPGPDGSPLPRRYIIVDAHHTLYEIAAEEGHVDCQRKLNEVLAHLLTGRKDTDHATE
jgi:hypothetical protein